MTVAFAAYATAKKQPFSQKLLGSAAVSLRLYTRRGFAPPFTEISMDSSRIKREFDFAKQYFSYLELHLTDQGKLYVKAVLKPSSLQYYSVSIYFPNSYPNEMPTVYVIRPEIDSAPHQYKKGNICYLHPTMWNPGVHNLNFVVLRTAKWLSKYEVWKQKRIWPGAAISH